jgi:hypothetical protein
VSDRFQQSYSKEEGNLFLFSVMLGAIISAGGSTAAAAAVTQAKIIGHALGLPQDVIASCVKEPSFDPLRLYLHLQG